MSNLSVFNFADQEIRVVGTPEWPLWVAMDVCNILEVKNPSDALKRLDDDEKDNLVLNSLNVSFTSQILTLISWLHSFLFFNI